MRLRSIFLASDSFVFANRVMQREPGMADSHNRVCSSEREFAFRGQGFAVVQVCHALLGQQPASIAPKREVHFALSRDIVSLACTLRAKGCAINSVVKNCSVDPD